ncbi:MAG TPA: DUF4013 domain-containing protein [Thermoanaerobaculia bacterium]|nr:DUF4013 domain-containing protein [Thermoanaerobaculia bacterium]
MTDQPPVPAARQTIDFGRPFSFTFEDPDWIRKILIGGVMYLLAFVLIGMFFIFGYLARFVRNVAAGAPRPLPEWDQWGRDFGEGVRLFAIMLIYYSPIILIMMVMIVGPAIIGAAGAEHSDAAGALASGVFTFGMCLTYGLILVIAVILPAALTLAVMRQSFSAAFEFATIFAYVRENAVNYVLAIVIYLVAGFLAQFGIILLCVGVVFTAFWSQLVSAYAFAETYRFSRVR